jgi:hypothetical protein
VNKPDPLVPSELDLRGLPWMPLDITRLLDSDLFALATAEEFKAALTLWCKSWHQAPGGSLSSDPRVLAHLSGSGVRWQKIKAMALRGWVECSDGRLYHPVVAESALKAWGERLRYQAKRDTDTERLKTWREKKRLKGELSKVGGLKDVPRGTETPIETSDETQVKHVSEALGNLIETPLKRLRQGSEVTGTKSPSADAAKAVDNFAIFWVLYPRKDDKQTALKSFQKINPNDDLMEKICEAVRVQSKSQQWTKDNGSFIPLPATWLNKRRWEDESIVEKVDAAEVVSSTEILWGELRNCIRSNKSPTNPAIVHGARALGGIGRLGAMNSFDIDRLRPQFDQAVRSYQP